MVLKGPPRQVPIAGNIHQRPVGVPPAQLPSQPEAVPLAVLQVHVQKIDAPPVVLHRLQKGLGTPGGAYHLHVVVLHEDLPLQRRLDLVEDRLLVVTEIDMYHRRPPILSSCTNTPSAQLVEPAALGYSARMRW